MAYWLVKSEPGVYSWEQFRKDKKTVWDGVRNYAARNNLRNMKAGEEVLFYHSNEGMEIVGVCKVSREFFQDPTTDNPNWVSVELKPVKKLKVAVGLSSIKDNPRLSEMDLVRLGRLSVQQVRDFEWQIVMQMAGER